MLSSNQRQRLSALERELLARKLDSLKLYQPMPHQQRFLDSGAYFRIARGGNQAGKTSACAYEVARAARGLHPHFGTRPLIIYIIVDKQDHIGRVIHNALFRSGLFDVIRDPVSGEPRAAVPSLDGTNNPLCKPSLPLISESKIEEWSWYNKAARDFHMCRLRSPEDGLDSGTVIYAFSGAGSCPQGQPVDMIWIDEDLRDAKFIPELAARVIKRNGKILWSAFPHDSNEALTNASEIAAKQVGTDSPTHVEVMFPTMSNIYLSEEGRKNFFESLSPEERAARLYGEFSKGSYLMYPMFHKETHETPRDGNPHYIDKLCEDEIPKEWTRYLAIDPGYTYAAVIAGAIPPPSIGDYLILYDELLIQQCTAEKLAKALVAKFSTQAFEAFIIDEHGSRVTDAGTGRTIKAQYSRAFADAGLVSNRTGSGFLSGCDDRAGRAAMVRSRLSIGGNGTATLLFHRGRLPNLIYALGRYKKHLKQDVYQDVADPSSRFSHLPNCLEYLVAAQPRYVRPVPKEAFSPIMASFEEWQKQWNASRGDAIWLGPGSGRM
jgi:hypothetical protein